MKTLAIVDCGNLVCNKCMWLEKTWCQLFDGYPEQFDDDFKPLDKCMDGRKTAEKYLYNQNNNSQIPYKIKSTSNNIQRTYFKCPRCFQYTTELDIATFDGFYCPGCKLTESQMKELTSEMTPQHYKKYYSGGLSEGKPITVQMSYKITWLGEGTEIRFYVKCPTCNQFTTEYNLYRNLVCGRCHMDEADMCSITSEMSVEEYKNYAQGIPT